MKHTSTSGVTLIELIVSMMILSVIALGAVGLLQTVLQTHAYASTQQNLHLEAYQIMTRITTGLRNTTHAMIPNSHAPNRPLLVYSANINQDADYYYNHPLFPRVDEDCGSDMTNDGAAGVKGIDDDGDGIVDGLLNLGIDNDDEDGGILLGVTAAFVEEEKWDGTDNDGDGTIDEDVGADMNADGRSGSAGMDDNWTGVVDGCDAEDDDCDGQVNEDWFDPLIFSYNSATNTLTERLTMAGEVTVVSEIVSAFSAVYEAPNDTHGPRYLITLSLTDGGQTVTLSEYVFPRNTLQRLGKKVR